MAFGVNFTYQTAPLIWLVVSLPAALLLSEHFSVFWRLDTMRIITSTLELGFVGLCLATRTRLLLSPTAIKLLCATLISMLISTLFGAHPWAGITRWLEWLSHSVFGVYLYAYLRTCTHAKKRVLTLTLIGLVLFILAILALTWGLLSSPRTYNWITDPPFFVNLRHLGHIVALLLPIGWLLLLPLSTPHSQLTQPAIAISRLRILSSTGFLTLCWGLVFWMGGRGAFLSSVIVAMVFLFIARPLPWWLRIMALILPILLGALIANIAHVDNPSMGLERTLGIAHAQQLGNNPNFDISSSRWEIWQQSLIHWQQSPIWGLGADWFKFALPVIGIDDMFHPHNAVVQWLSSYGVVGLASLLATLGYGVYQYIYALRSTLNSGLTAPSLSIFMSQSFGLCVISGALLSQVSGVAYAPFSIFVWIILAALAWPETTTHSNILFKHTASTYHSGHIQTALTLTLILLGIVTNALYTAQVHHAKVPHAEPSWRVFNAKIPLFYEPKVWLEDPSISKQEKEQLKLNALRWSDNQCAYKGANDVNCK